MTPNPYNITMGLAIQYLQDHNAKSSPGHAATAVADALTALGQFETNDFMARVLQLLSLHEEAESSGPAECKRVSADIQHRVYRIKMTHKKNLLSRIVAMLGLVELADHINSLSDQHEKSKAYDEYTEAEYASSEKYEAARDERECKARKKAWKTNKATGQKIAILTQTFGTGALLTLPDD